MLMVAYDGSCKGNQLKCKDESNVGYGVYVKKGDKEIAKIHKNNLSDHIDKVPEFDTAIDTNNRAELYGLILGLTYVLENEWFDVDEIVFVYDNVYSKRTVTEWYANWVANKQLDKKTNLDLIQVAHKLWKKLTKLRYKIKFQYTESRSKLSKKEARRQIKQIENETKREYAWGNYYADELSNER